MSLVSRFAVFLSAVVVLELLVPAALTAQESVDFSKKPAVGARFKVTETSTAKMDVTASDGVNEMEFTVRTVGKQVFTHKILAVQDGKITKVEREYEDAGEKQTAEASMLPEPQEREQSSPLAWKTVRGEWNGDEFSLKVKAGDEWTDAGEKIRNRLPAGKLRNRVLPLPEGIKKIGESWELGTEKLKEFFSAAQLAQANAEMDGTMKMTLDSFTEVNGIKCAVIKFKAEIRINSEGVTAKLTTNGIAHYSLEHCFVIGMKSKGRAEFKQEREQMGQATSKTMKSDKTVEHKVEVLGNSDE